MFFAKSFSIYLASPDTGVDLASPRVTTGAIGLGFTSHIPLAPLHTAEGLERA